jgi:hypothetical protein
MWNEKFVSYEEALYTVLGPYADDYTVSILGVKRAVC